VLPLAEADYPFLNILGSMILFFFWVAWIWTVFAVLGDIYRRHDISGVGKAAWTVVIIAIPFLGVLIYLVGHGGQMAERNAQQAEAMQEQYAAHIREVAGSGGAAAEIAKAKELRDSGAISEPEFEQIKRKALA
jgi:hypothetical protein